MLVRNRAFSLVELSIVLIIIGLLVAGVSGGSQLIEQSKIRKVISEVKDLRVNLNLFRSAYGQFPGDFDDADSFWPGCNSGATTEECNGNGDGRIDLENNEGEPLRLWQHLFLAEILTQSYSGVLSSGTVKVNVNVPKSIMGKTGGYYIRNAVDVPINAVPLAGLTIVAGSETATSVWLSNKLFTSRQAYFIDKKMDDGLASSGKVKPNFYYEFSTWHSDKCLDGTFPNKTFKLQSTDVECVIYFTAEE